ncbi:MAG: hypothetical protein J6A05_00575 [Oscillospiraceae bacterium]|nr:hypothetical protein [Oscillospiraceae bacterium]
MEDMKNCPFCGSYANLESFKRNDDYYYIVNCSNSKCRIRTEPVRVGFNERFEGERNVDVTPLMAINHVVASWNKRTEGSDDNNNTHSSKVTVRRVK